MNSQPIDEHSAHTPGPWCVFVTPDGTTEVWQQIPICMLAYYPDYPGRQSLPQANARLIAAAPEMLAALREVLECSQLLRDARLTGQKHLIEGRTGGLAYAEVEARAVLAKAKGTS